MTEPSPVVLSAPDAGNRSAGEALRLAREAQGITLEKLASTIKVTPAKLDALERGQYGRLPDPSFTRALAMTVCRALRLDPSPILAALPAAKPFELAGGKPSLNQPFKESRGTSLLFDRQWSWSSILSIKWLAPIALLLGALLILVLPDSIDVPGTVQRWFQPAAKPVIPAPAADITPAAPAIAPLAPPVAVASSAKPGLVPLQLDEVDAAASYSVASSSAVLVPPFVDPRLVNSTPAPSASRVSTDGDSAALLVNARQASWIEVRDAKGSKLLSRHVQAGEQIVLGGLSPLNVLIGNAAGVQLRYKGQPVEVISTTHNNVARLELK
ncbi:MAG: helix-turn-helix domain-containing protein [Aquabacterium sp.]|nr:helix-turn-helix domain-containing protein [Aquabacterium sp.]